MASEAVIHFFGLVVATTQVIGGAQMAKVATQINSKTQVVMIMPDIAKLNSRATTARAAQKPIPSTVKPSQIEPHTTLIIFAARDFLSSRGFDINRLSDDYLSIELKGDVITFVANGEDRTPSLNEKLPRLRGGTLRQEFKAPLYSDAAAVFKIPFGELTTCTSVATNTVGRVDNELHLKNSGTVSINSGAKSLTLNGEAEVYAGNAPMAYVMSHAGKAAHNVAGLKPHYFAYCWMIGKSDEECTMPDQSGLPADCITNKQRPVLGANAAGNLPPPPIFMATSFECSNTQWP